MIKRQESHDKKNLKYLVPGLCLLVIWAAFSSDYNIQKDNDCAFCDATVLNFQKFYEDELVVALFTHKPALPGHMLVIPKRHVERFEMLTDSEIMQIGCVIKKVNLAAEKVFGTSAYLLLQKNGQEVGQTVPHVHIHYIPRKHGDSSSVMFMIKMYLANIKSPIKPDEMQKNTEMMKELINTIN